MDPTHLSSRIGIVVPSSNTVAEVDFYRNVPESMTVHTARMHLIETTAAGERAMLEEYLPQSIRDLASLQPDVVAFGCTSAGALIGYDGEQRLIEEIAGSCACPVVSTNDAVGRCIERHAPRRIAIVSPYIEELNEKIRAGVERRSIEVIKVAGMGITENVTIAAVSPDQIVRFAAEQLAGLDFDLLFASCTNFRAMAALGLLEQRFGTPVVSSNQACLQITLETLAATRQSAQASVPWR
jgi:maleate isomerase